MKAKICWVVLYFFMLIGCGTTETPPSPAQSDGLAPSTTETTDPSSQATTQATGQTGSSQGQGTPPRRSSYPANALVFQFAKVPLMGVLVPEKLGSRLWSTFRLTWRSNSVEGEVADPGVLGYGVQLEEWMDMGAEGGHPGHRKPLASGAKPGEFLWTVGFTMPGEWQIHLRLLGLATGGRVVDEVMQTIQVP